MLLRDIWALLEEKVFPRASTEILFNQYKDVVPRLDLPDGDRIRRENLRNYLKSFERPPRTLIVGEAAGPWGCRFSGIPFTSERQLVERVLPVGGRQSSTRTLPYSENSASIFWGLMAEYHPDFFIWNAVPYHPHKKGEPLSIRRPGKREIAESLDALGGVAEILKPQKVIALGRTAEAALRMLRIEPLYVRHPSQAGASSFREAMTQILRRLK